MHSSSGAGLSGPDGNNVLEGRPRNSPVQQNLDHLGFRYPDFHTPRYARWVGRNDISSNA